MALSSTAVLLVALWGGITAQYWIWSAPSQLYFEVLPAAWLCWLLIYLVCVVRAQWYQCRNGGHKVLLSIPSRSAAYEAVLAVTVTVLLMQHTASFVLPLATMLSYFWTLSNARSQPCGDIENTFFTENSLPSVSERFGELFAACSVFIPRIAADLACVLLLLWAETNSSPSAAARSVAQSIVFAILLQFLNSSVHKAQLSTPSACHEDYGKRIGEISAAAVVLGTPLFLLQTITAIPSFHGLVAAINLAVWWTACLVVVYSGDMLCVSTLPTIAASFHLFRSLGQTTAATAALIATGLASWQCFNFSKSTSKLRWLLFTPLIAAPLTVLEPSRHRTLAPLRDNSAGPVTRLHPVQVAISEARRDFEVRLANQSETLLAATAEYIRRYGVPPPPHFDKWFQFARENSFVLIDEFDTIMASLLPYLKLPPSHLRRLCTAAAQQLPDQLLTYSIRQGQVVTNGGTRSSWIGESMRRMLPAPWISQLADMSLVINVFDEPKVVIPNDFLDLILHGQNSSLTPSKGPENLSVDMGPTFLDLSRQDAWEAISLACSPSQKARQIYCAKDPPGPSVELIRNVTNSKDVCSHCDVHRQHGFLLGPETLRLTHTPVPILSQAKPSVFGDILFPSPYYIEKAKKEKSDGVEWAQKDSILYWTGSATGGHATESNWQHMQRQRLTLLVANEASHIRLLRETPLRGWTPYSSTMGEISRLLSIRISRISGQCDAPTCEEEKHIFGVGNEEILDPMDEAHKHKFLLDMDGNSFSGRFHRLLRTNSVVFKQTLFQEWHDDRLLPWVHFIPINTDFAELPEVLRYLATTEVGDALARTLGEESRLWAERSLRPVDMQLVWFRILLEMARILGD